MTDGPRAATAQGTVIGRAADGIARFLGIPYAQSPVGALRFAAPAPPEDFDGPFDASLFGPVPPQITGARQIDFGPQRAGDDWLTVNVWTPESALPDSALPVMVWIHGGAYIHGASAEPSYDGTALARLGVVVVSLNYRLGIDGWALFPDAPANRGLLDQIAALEWVRANISGFGGDPDAVTVFGESAGAGSIHALLTMPEADGLFGRAILQSVPAMMVAADLAESATQALAELAGIPATGEAFSALSPAECSELSLRLAATPGERARSWGRASAYTIPLCPVVDGTVLRRDPWEALRDGAAAGIDLLISHTRDEYRLFLSLGGVLGRITAEKADSSLARFAPRSGAEDYARLIADASPEDRFEAVRTDWMFTVPALDTAQAHTDAGGRTHVCLIDVDPAGGLGAPHAVDVPLLFDRYDGDFGVLMFPEPSEADRRTGAAMRRAWVDFALTGDPGWPHWDAKRLIRIWDGEDPVTAHPLAERWQAYADDPAAAVQLVHPAGPDASSRPGTEA